MKKTKFQRGSIVSPQYLNELQVSSKFKEQARSDYFSDPTSAEENLWEIGSRDGLKDWEIDNNSNSALGRLAHNGRVLGVKSSSAEIIFGPPATTRFNAIRDQNGVFEGLDSNILLPTGSFGLIIESGSMISPLGDLWTWNRDYLIVNGGVTLFGIFHGLDQELKLLEELPSYSVPFALLFKINIDQSGNITELVDLRPNTHIHNFYNYSQEISSTQLINEDYLASSGERILVDTRDGPVTITLPSDDNSIDSDQIIIIDAFNSFGTHPLTIIPNLDGGTINSGVEDYSVAVDGAVIDLFYYDSPTEGLTTWKFEPSFLDYLGEEFEYNNKKISISTISADKLIDGTNNVSFTKQDSAKLDSIEEGAQVNVLPDWNTEVNSDPSFIKNKPNLSVFLTPDSTLSADRLVDGIDNKVFTSQDKEKLDKVVNLIRVDTKTSDYIANSLESIPCDTSGGSFIITLPASGGIVNIFDNVGINNKSGFTLFPLTINSSNSATIMGGDDYKLFVGGTNATFELIDNDWKITDLSYPNQPKNSENVYWVDPNGDDTNSGKLPTDPLKTIKRALEIINEKAAVEGNNGDSNDCIKLRAGVYIEEAPLIVRRGVAIMADSLRVTEIRPTSATKNNNLFLVDSGVKFWGITFAGHQAGSFAVAFNPGADNRAIGADDLGAYILKSPYIQNCTSYTAEDDAGLAGSVSDGATGGGLEVDGAKCASNSPIRSMVVDSYTQVNLGGPGCLVKNDGYAQLVSFFSTFCTYHVRTESGGQVNLSGGGTTDFGELGLVANGYSSIPLFTGESRVKVEGVNFNQLNATIDINDNKFIVSGGVKHELSLGDPVVFNTTGEVTLGDLGLSAETYYVAEIPDDFTFKVSGQPLGSSGGDIIVDLTNTKGFDLTENPIEFRVQGAFKIDVINFSPSRLGTIDGAISRPTSGQLMFPQLIVPRNSETKLPESRSYEYTKVAGTNKILYQEIEEESGIGLDYVSGGTATIANKVYNVVDAVYNKVTREMELEIDGDDFNDDGNVTVKDLIFIDSTSAYVVTSSVPIKSDGSQAIEIEDIAGYSVYFYSSSNRYLKEDINKDQIIDFRNRSQISAPSHTFEFVGSGTNYKALPFNGGVSNPGNKIVEENNGRVYSSNTDELGNFAVGTQFTVDGTTGSVTINTDQFNLSGLNAIGPFSRSGIDPVGVQLKEVSNNVALIASTGAVDSNTVPTQYAVEQYLINNYVPVIREITTSLDSGLTGGNDLRQDLDLSLSSATKESLAKADTALQPEDIQSNWANVQSDWNVTDENDDAFIKNKPTLGEANVQSDWDETDATDPAFIKNKPTLGEANVQSDWDETVVTDPAFIKNKPTLGTASEKSIEDFATAAQGDLADTAVQSFVVTQDIKTTNYTASDLESIPCDTSGGSFEITLPTSGKVNIFDNLGIDNKSGFTLFPLTVKAPTGTTVMRGSNYKLFVGGTNATFELIGDDWKITDLSYPNQPKNSENVYWVDPNGDDTNSGKLPTDPLKTIKRALEIINEKAVAEGNNGDSNDCIKLRAGVYIEEAPLIVRRGVAIMADSLRVTEIRPTPATKNNNLFLVDSGVKFWGITFAGHQAGSFAVAFNPGADNRAIGANDLGAYILKSPYIQNCTSYTAEDDAGLAGSVSDGATGGGLEVDGAKCAPNSPIRSMVVDSFTQVNLGGPGCLVKNDGYAQLVSFFSTFCTYHVRTESGGQVNLSGGGTTDFGIYGLVADGYSSIPLFTGESRVAVNGVVYTQGTVTISADGTKFSLVGSGSVELELENNDKIKLIAIKELKLEDVGLDPSDPEYFVVNVDKLAGTFQISESADGNAITMAAASPEIDITEVGAFEFKIDGAAEIDVINFSSSRLGTVPNAISRPTAGQLMFPQLVFPRDPQTKIPAPKTFGYTRIDNNTLEYYEQTSDVFHEYVDGGTVTINGTSYSVVNAIYENETGRVEIEIDGTLPTSSTGNATVSGLKFICPREAYVVTGSVPINFNGTQAAENSTDVAGYKVYFYSQTNAFLQYDLEAGQIIDFRNRSQISAPSHTFEFVGSGTNYRALPFNGGVPNPGNKILEENNGRVYSSNTDELGNFAVGTQFAVDGTNGSVTINTDQFNLSGLNFIGPFSRNGGISTVGEQLREVSNNPSLIASTGAPDANTVPTQFAVKTFVEGKTINTGSGLTGGGNLEQTRTLALNQASIDSLAAADSAVQPGDSISSLTWSSFDWQ